MTFLKSPHIVPFIWWEIKSYLFPLFASLRDVTPDYKSPDHDERLMEEKGGFNTRNEHLMGKGQK